MVQRVRYYLKIVFMAVALLYAVVFTSKFLQKSIHRTSKTKAAAAGRIKVHTTSVPTVGTRKPRNDTSSALKKASGTYTDKLKLNMNIPEEIRNCANKTVSTPYKYDYNADTFLPPPVSDLCKMTIPDLELLYHRYLNSIQTACKRTIRFGKLTDGGWDVCAEQQYLPRNSCLVYSFGINFDFSFDDDISSSFGCEVHSFDPSMKMKSHVRHKDKVFFHDSGLSDVTRTDPKGDEWRMLTFKDVRTELKHLDRMPDVMKMDIEAWEWNVLPEMFATGQFPKQIILEYHLWSQKYTTQKDMWIRRHNILRAVYDAGYRIFWMNRNLICRYQSLYQKKLLLACHEISLIRNGPNVLKIDSL